MQNESYFRCLFAVSARSGVQRLVIGIASTEINEFFCSVCRTVIEGAGFAWHFPSTVYEVIVRRTGIKLLFISQMCVRVCEGTCVKKSCRCVILQPPPVVIDNAINVVYTSSSTCSRSGSAPTCRFV